MGWYHGIAHAQGMDQRKHMKNIAEARFLEKVCVAPVEYVFHETKS